MLASLADRFDLRSLILPAAVAAAAVAFGLLAGVRPDLALAGAAGLAFLFLLLANLVVGLCAFVLLTFFAVLASPDAGVVKLAGLLLTVVWIGVASTEGQVRPRLGFVRENPALAAFLALFLAWAALSLVWASDVGDARVALLRYFLNAVLLLIVFTAVTERRHVVWIYWAFSVGGVASMIYGVILAPAESSEFNRVQGAGVDSNDLAIVLVAGMILAAALAVTSERAPAKIGAGLISLLCGAGVLLTFSRTGLFTLALALIGGLLFASRRRARSGAAALAVILVAVAYVIFFAPPEARERITTVGNGSGRTDLWTVAWRMVEDKPVAGVGAGNFPVTSFNYVLEPGALDARYLISPTGLLQVAHNSYLEVMAELGVIGFTLFVVLLILAVVAASRAAKNFMRAGDRRMETLSRALVAAQVGMLGGSVFTSLQYSKQMWLLLALGPALLSLSRSLTADNRSA